MNCKANKLTTQIGYCFSFISLALLLLLTDASSCVSCRTATFFVTSMAFLTHYQFYLTFTFKYRKIFWWLFVDFPLLFIYCLTIMDVIMSIIIALTTFYKCLKISLSSSEQSNEIIMKSRKIKDSREMENNLIRIFLI